MPRSRLMRVPMRTLHPNNAFENGRSQASLRSLARAVQRGRYIFRMRSLFVYLMLIPTTAHASGGDIVYLVFGEFVVLVLVIVSLNVVKIITFERKVLVFVAYFIGAAIPLFLTNKLPYSDNLVLINMAYLATPVVAWLSALWFMCRGQGKNITVRSRGDA